METPILFNLTIKLSKEDSSGWLDLLKTRVLPQCTDGKIIRSSQINKIMIEEEDGDETFAVQFIYNSNRIFAEYKLSTMSKFLGMIDEQYQGKYVYFASMMEIIHQEA